MRLATYLTSLEATEPENPAHGLLRQGYGNIRLVYHADKNDVFEDYEDVPARGFSTENNISSWFFLHSLGEVTGDARWSSAADRIRDALLRVAWDKDLGQFDQGFSPGGQRDAVRALDCASWGALFLLATAKPKKPSRRCAMSNNTTPPAMARPSATAHTSKTIFSPVLRPAGSTSPTIPGNNGVSCRSFGPKVRSALPSPTCALASPIVPARSSTVSVRCKLRRAVCATHRAACRTR